MSPRTSKQFQEIREEKRTLIMDTALEHFASEGYHAVTITDLAKHAGISKGLMYNYFESKEALLRAIIQRSVSEVQNYFDTDRDGFLSGEEFEFFVRKLGVLLKQKRDFWRLLFQILMQGEVREQFLSSFVGASSLESSGINPAPDMPAAQIMRVITDYFIRKGERMGPGYDSIAETKLFMLTVKGYAITSIYAGDGEEEDNEKIINRIIEMFK
ncbi:MAG: TetR/AcrR family transcriptional regulator [Bacteroidales bacterium]|jgi:AcrR family transcriptional regulator|nr:TetR/AcrR family transcriptional regulator [Bacteroidales bacterium]